MGDGDEDVFRAFADGHRRRIISALCGGSMVAGELGRLVGLAPNAVSFHLRWLRQAGLVSVQREGRYLRYRADRRALADWRAHLERLFPAAEDGEPTSRRPGRREQAAVPGSPQGRPSPSEPSRPVAETRARGEGAEPLPTELL